MDSRALLYEDLCFCRAANYLWSSSLSLSFSLSPFSSLCLYQCISLSFSLHLVPRVPAWLDARTEATYTSVIDFRFNLIKRRCAGFQRICLAFSVWTGKRESYCARCSLEFTIVSLGCHKTVCTPVGPSAEWQSGFLFFFRMDARKLLCANYYIFRRVSADEHRLSFLIVVNLVGLLSSHAILSRLFLTEASIIGRGSILDHRAPCWRGIKQSNIESVRS